MGKSIPSEPDGATPLDDISGLKAAGVRTRAQLFAAEAMNIALATEKYLAAVPSRRKAPFTLDWVYRLHREMFGRVWTWAGRKRTTEKNIGVPAWRIDTDLAQALEDALFWRDHNSFPPIEQAARLHHRAVHVHPFENGNGRWARMLANIWLKQNSGMVTRWPEEIIGAASAIRQDYLAAIRAADQQDYRPLVWLHKKYTREAEEPWRSNQSKETRPSRPPAKSAKPRRKSVE